MIFLIKKKLKLIFCSLMSGRVSNECGNCSVVSLADKKITVYFVRKKSVFFDLQMKRERKAEVEKEK